MLSLLGALSAHYMDIMNQNKSWYLIAKCEQRELISEIRNHKTLLWLAANFHDSNPYRLLLKLKPLLLGTGIIGKSICITV